jgi:UDP-N-acetylmuramate dehydrogenase
MNAGANGKETADALVEVEWMSPEGVMQRWARSELRFSYRHSPFQEMGGAIVSARFVLTPHEEARTHQLQILDYRLKTQPYKDKSAGCIFRNPPGAKGAGALIDQCGLKGVRVGGAKVSEMHANFLVNVDRATAEEVQTLILLVQKRVFEETGYFLEPEVRIIAP